MPPGGGHPKPTRPLCPGAVSPARRQRTVIGANPNARNAETGNAAPRSADKTWLTQRAREIGPLAGSARAAQAILASFHKKPRAARIGESLLCRWPRSPPLSKKMPAPPLANS